MTARLATEGDEKYIRDLLEGHKPPQFWSPEAIAQLITDKRHLTVIDPDTKPPGLFWLTQDSDDPTLLHAGITFSSGTVQTTAMLKLMVEINPWPNWAKCRVQADPAVCAAEAKQAITDVAKMTETGAVGKAKVYEITKATLLANLGTKVK